YELAKDYIEVRELDRVRVAGKTEPVTVYELLSLKGELDDGTRQLVAAYEDALRAYQAGNFGAAMQLVRLALEIDHTDGPSRRLATKCEHYLSHPPPAGFDGVSNLEK